MNYKALPTRIVARSRDGRRSELLLLAANALAGVWLALAMPVFAQESYYWSYAQHPSLSYHDHPPMIAWLIWLGTAVFGDGAAGIRLLVWASGFAVVLLGHRLLREFAAPARARLAWLVLGLCVPSLVAIRFLANPDPPLCAFWLATMLLLWRARGGGLGWWLAAGAAAGCALLSKYTAVFLAVGGLLALLFDPALRRQLRRPGPWLGVATAALVFLPVPLWNVANDFESFRFQTEGRWDKAAFGLHWLGQFVGGQLLVLNPIVALAVPAAAWWTLRRSRRGDMRALWLVAFGAPMTLFLLGSSLFVQVKINWLEPAALPLLLATALWWGRAPLARRAAPRRLAMAAAVLAALLLLAPLIVLLPQHRGTTWTGWDEIAARAEHWESEIDEPDGVEGNVFFFAGDYRDAAQLMRNLKTVVARLEPGEVVEPTLAQNVVGQPALQFDHWDLPAAHKGQSAVFVLPRAPMRQSFLAMVNRRFASVERVETVDVRRLGIEVMSADIFVCRQYLGPQVE